MVVSFTKRTLADMINGSASSTVWHQMDSQMSPLVARVQCLPLKNTLTKEKLLDFLRSSRHLAAAAIWQKGEKKNERITIENLNNTN